MALVNSHCPGSAFLLSTSSVTSQTSYLTFRSAGPILSSNVFFLSRITSVLPAMAAVRAVLLLGVLIVLFYLLSV